MATLLVGRWLLLRNQAAAEESVDDRPCAKQIRQGGKAGFAMFGLGFHGVIGRFPVGPTGGDERAAAIGKHHEQQQDAAALDSAHDGQKAALEWMSLAQYRH
jgi:hypothetical protein